MFIDESSAKTNMCTLYGRSTRGQRCHASAPGSWKTTTMLASIRLNGQTESLVFDGAVDKPMFSAYLDDVLLHTLKDGDILRHFLIETLCVSIHTLPTLPRKAGQAREKRGFPAGWTSPACLRRGRPLCVRQAVAVGELESLTDSDSDCKNKAVSLLMLSLSIASCVATAKAATAIFNGILLYNGPLTEGCGPLYRYGCLHPDAVADVFQPGLGKKQVRKHQLSRIDGRSDIERVIGADTVKTLHGRS